MAVRSDTAVDVPYVTSDWNWFHVRLFRYDWTVDSVTEEGIVEVYIFGYAVAPVNIVWYRFIYASVITLPLGTDGRLFIYTSPMAVYVSV